MTKATEEPHRELCSFVQTWKDKDRKLILTPRGCLKTSMVTIGYSLFEIWHFPDIRILLIAEERGKARLLYLAAIKNIIEKNPIFRAVVGNLVADRGWTEDYITVSCRRNHALKEPTISIAGIDSSDQGPHYDLIIADDLQGKTNVNTQAQIQKVIDNFQLINPLMDEGARLVVIGTRWDYADLYNYILTEEKEFYDVMIKSAYNKDGTLYWPEGLPHKKLEDLKKRMSVYFFSCQYLNDPVPAETAIFRKEYFKYWRPKDLPSNLRIYMTVDPASTISERSDKTAIIVNGYDSAMNCYNLYNFHGRMLPTDTANKVVEIYKRFHPIKLGLEVTGAKFFPPVLRECFNRSRIVPNIIELSHAGYGAKKKEDRIQELEPWFREGKIYFEKGNSQDLEMQFLKFPRKKGHDDLIDAFAMQLEIIDAYEGEDETEPIYTYTPRDVVTGV